MTQHSGGCPLCQQEASYTTIDDEHCFDCAQCGRFRVAMEAEDRLRRSRPALRQIWSQMSQAGPENYYLAFTPADSEGPRLSMVGLSIRYRAVEVRGQKPGAAAEHRPSQ